MAFSLASARRNLAAPSLSTSPSLYPSTSGLFLFCAACLCKAVVVTLPVLFIIVRAAKDADVAHSRPRPIASPPGVIAFSLLFARRALHHARALWLFWVAAAATVALTQALNSDGDASTTARSGSLDANAGLFWAPASLSPLGQLAKAAAATLAWYPSRLAHPSGLRVLYLVPKTFAGTADETEEEEKEKEGGNDAAVSPTNHHHHHRYSRRAEWVLSAAAYVAVVVIVAGVLVALFTATASHQSRRWQRRWWAEGACAAAYWALGWAILLLPTLGFASHGYTLLGEGPSFSCYSVVFFLSHAFHFSFALCPWQ